MTDSFADIIRQLIINKGLGTVNGSFPVFVSYLPAEPDEAIVVYDTAGILDGRIMATGRKIEHPGVQVQIRGEDYPLVFRRARQIAQAFDLVNREVVELLDASGSPSFLIQNISRTGDILPMGIEEQDTGRRHYFSINAVLTASAIE